MAIKGQFLRSIALDLRRVESLDRYPLSMPAVQHLGRLEFHPRCTFLVGENGSGKSTILEALAISMGLQPEGGSRSFRFSTHDSHSNLHRYLSVEKGILRPNDMYFLRAESFYNVATEIERLDKEGGAVSQFYGGSLHAKSHGEAFFSLFTRRMFGRGLYIIDEPEAALSPNRQLALLARMSDLIRADSQFVIATHSPIVMAYPDAWIYEFTEEGPRRVEYEDTEHFQVTQSFLSHRESMLKELLRPDDSDE